MGPCGNDSSEFWLEVRPLGPPRERSVSEVGSTTTTDDTDHCSLVEGETPHYAPASPERDHKSVEDQGGDGATADISPGNPEDKGTVAGFLYLGRKVPEKGCTDDPSIEEHALPSPVSTEQCSSIPPRAQSVTSSKRTTGTPPPQQLIYLGTEQLTFNPQLTGSNTLDTDVDARSAQTAELAFKEILCHLSEQNDHAVSQLRKLRNQQELLEAHWKGVEKSLSHERSILDANLLVGLQTKSGRLSAGHSRHSNFSERQGTVSMDSLDCSDDAVISQTFSMTPGSARRTRRMVTNKRLVDVGSRLADVYESTVTMYQVPQERRVSRHQKFSKSMASRTLELQAMLHMPECPSCPMMEDIVESKRFQATVTVVILLNAFFVGITGDLFMRHALEEYDQQQDLDQSAWINPVEMSFGIFFFVELLMRLIALQDRFFFGDEWRWNVFDTVLVLSNVAELSLSFMASAGHARVLRASKVVRSARMLRIMRFNSVFRKLRIVILTIFNCATMLMWAILSLALVVYIVAMIFLHGVALYISEASAVNPNIDDMRTFFGSLPLTMLTLFMSVAGGIDWWVVITLLQEVSEVYACVFILYVVISQLAVLNVISAIFVGDAMETTRMDNDLRMQVDMEETKLAIQTLAEMFERACGEDGTITPTDFISKFGTMDGKMNMAALGLHFSDALTMFKCLDVDNNGEIEKGEFVMGCLRLKNGANLMDMEVSMRESALWLERAMKEQVKSLEDVADSVRCVCERLGL